MPKRFLAILFVAGLAAGAFFFHQHYEIEGLDAVNVRPRAASNSPGELPDRPPVNRSGDTIRIATFNIQVFGTSKSDKPDVMKVLVDVVRRFDIVAVQEIRSKDQTLIPRFVDQINADGAAYNYVLGERLGNTSSKEQYAFLFDTASIEVDRNETSTYTAGDPGNRLHREPLVAWFRVRGPPPDQAFTFKLINIHTDPDETDEELDALDDVFIAVQNDSDQEDDVILLGDLNVDNQHLGELGRLLDITWVVTGRTPTNTLGTKQYDNIVFNRRATTEYTGRGGVMDLMSVYGMTRQQAKSVSDHLPVWAEFRIYEDGAGQRVAFGRRPAVR